MVKTVKCCFQTVDVPEYFHGCSNSSLKLVITSLDQDWSKDCKILQYPVFFSSRTKADGLSLSPSPWGPKDQTRPDFQALLILLIYQHSDFSLDKCKALGLPCSNGCPYKKAIYMQYCFRPQVNLYICHSSLHPLQQNNSQQ